VREREPYCLENRLNCCEVGKVHDDNDDDDDDDDDDDEVDDDDDDGGDADECDCRRRR